MSIAVEPPPPRTRRRSRVRQTPRRPRTFQPSDYGALGGCALSAIALMWLVCYRIAPVGSAPAFWVLAYVTFLGIYGIVVGQTLGRLVAVDRVVTVAIASVGLLIVAALAFVIGTVVVKGITSISWTFLSTTMDGVDPTKPGGGIFHALVGTLEQVALAMLISVPLGVLTAIFLNEVGGRMARPVRFVVDAMSGVPSIVAGLFIYAIWLVQFGFKFSGFAAALALSVLMLPSITRTTEEVLRLVPDGLREASLAMGSPEWRSTWHVVLPTARAGIVTAVILGVARAIGETAPLIMTSFGSSVLETNPFKNPQQSLPLFIYQSVRQPLPVQIDRAWGAALVLIVLVLALFTLARVVGGRGLGGARRTRRKATTA